MQPNGMIFWDWNGTLMDDVDFTHSCLNWMLETHGYPQRYDLAAYRELFGILRIPALCQGSSSVNATRFGSVERDRISFSSVSSIRIAVRFSCKSPAI